MALKIPLKVQHFGFLDLQGPVYGLRNDKLSKG